MIIPKQFLKTIKRTGLGNNLFFEMRYDDHGGKISEFILNQEPYNNSKILISDFYLEKFKIFGFGNFWGLNWLENFNPYIITENN